MTENALQRLTKFAPFADKLLPGLVPRPHAKLNCAINITHFGDVMQFIVPIYPERLHHSGIHQVMVFLHYVPRILNAAGVVTVKLAGAGKTTGLKKGGGIAKHG